MELRKMEPWQGLRGLGQGLGVLICLVAVAGAAPAPAQEFTRIDDALAYINQQLGLGVGCIKPPCTRHSVSVIKTSGGFEIQIDSRSPDGKSHDISRAPARLLDEKQAQALVHYGGVDGEVVVPCVAPGCVLVTDPQTGKKILALGWTSFGGFPTGADGLQTAERAVKSLIRLAKTTDQGH
jgi:hypothetical protein